jgi:MFS family permease
VPKRTHAARLAQPRAALLVVGLAQALVVVDGIPVAVALPAIRHDLELDVAEVQWIVNGYVLALAGGLLLAGRCGDIFGRRRLLMVGLSTLTIATLLAGLAPNGAVLVFARVVQGLGAAMALPAAMALIPALFTEPERRDRAYAITAVVGSSAWIVGALSGGILTDLVGWRFVFLATAPFSVLALMLARRTLPESRDDSADRRVDVGGAVLITCGLTSILYGITQVEAAGPTGGLFLGPLVLGFALLAGFVVLEGRFPQPLVPLSLFRVRELWGASLGVAANTAAYGGAVFIGTLYLQDALGYSPTVTGLVFLPLAAGALTGPWLARWLGHSGARSVGVVSLVVCAAALALFGWFAQLDEAPLAALVLTLLVFGVAQYAAWLAVVGQATAAVDHGQYGVASGVFKTSTHIGAAVAFAASSTIIEWVGSAPAGQANAYTTAYVAIAALTLAGAGAVAHLITPTATTSTRTDM